MRRQGFCWIIIVIVFVAVFTNAFVVVFTKIFIVISTNVSVTAFPETFVGTFPEAQHTVSRKMYPRVFPVVSSPLCPPLSLRTSIFSVSFPP